jgi:hypothetical protein
VKRYIAIAAGLTIGIIATIAVLATAARTSPGAAPYGEPIGPVMAHDTGAGEELILVVGGIYATRQEAETANAEMAFGDLQGYYVVPVDQFQGFRRQVGSAGDFSLASVFRTQEGADGFIELARTFDVPAVIYPQRVMSVGGLYAGLGQEPAPDGSGPLIHPVAQSLP